MVAYRLAAGVGGYKYAGAVGLLQSMKENNITTYEQLLDTMSGFEKAMKGVHKKRGNITEPDIDDVKIIMRTARRMLSNPAYKARVENEYKKMKDDLK